MQSFSIQTLAGEAFFTLLSWKVDEVDVDALHLNVSAVILVLVVIPTVFLNPVLALLFLNCNDRLPSSHQN